MTVNDMIEQAEHLVEEKYDTDLWIDWVQAVLDDLTPLTKLLAEEEVTLTIADEEATIDLTAISSFFDVVNVSIKPTGKRRMKLRKLPAYDSASMGWVRYPDSIKLQNLTWTTATAIVEYYEDLAMTASGSDYTINLPIEYHDTVVKGICASAMQKEEEFDRRNDFYGEYSLGKRRILSERTIAMEPWYASAVGGGGQ